MFKFIILDFDRTLVFLNADWPKVRQRISNLCEENGFSAHRELPLFDSIHRAYDDFLELTGDEEKAKKFYKNLLLINKEEESAGIEKSVPVTGALDFLKWLEKEKIRFGILSNNSRDTIEKCFEKFFFIRPEIIISNEDVWNQKPDIEGLQKMLIYAGLNINDCLFVGDSEIDALLGKNASIRTVILNTYYVENQKPRTFEGEFAENFDDIKSIIKK